MNRTIAVAAIFVASLYVIVALLSVPTAQSQQQQLRHVQVVCKEPPIIVGVTSAIFTGKVPPFGGTWSGHIQCDLDMPGTRMCTGLDVRDELFEFFPFVPESGVWVHTRSDEFPNCQDWTNESSQTPLLRGTAIFPGGRITNPACNTARPLLCCEQPPA